MHTHPVLLQAGIPAEWISPLMFGLIFVIFYFFLIRPQAQRQKKQTAFQEAIKKGDRVVTSSGILGRVSKVDAEAGVATLEVSKGTYLDITVGSISRELTEAKYGEAASE